MDNILALQQVQDKVNCTAAAPSHALHQLEKVCIAFMCRKAAGGQEKP
jgi:hypothetical protein